ncbi:hypothetical protein ABE504_26670 [Paenibacillus oryzisoli]|uniref:hypothetical protein n=1 Tax=Paenibacillus oryzisoli TaxID=1850517 RepID=UPI003D270C00
MRSFYVSNQSVQDIQAFYKLEKEKKAIVRGYDIMCFSEELSTSEFKRLMTKMPMTSSSIVSPAYIPPYKSEQHLASYLLQKPISVNDENAMLHLYHIITASMDNLLQGAVHKHEFDLRLVAFHADDTQMTKPFFMEAIPTFRNTWGARKATMTAKVDTFEGIPLKSVPDDLRRIWIDNIKKGLKSREPKPVHVKEAQDHLEVTWHFTGKVETIDLLSSVFWQPGHKDMIPTEVSYYYDLHEKEDFCRELDRLQSYNGKGDSYVPSATL